MRNTRFVPSLIIYTHQINEKKKITFKSYAYLNTEFGTMGNSYLMYAVGVEFFNHFYTFP